jgi:hypothetical protein
MNCFKLIVKLLTIVLVTTKLTACSRSVQWEEEVQMNTGETITVKRTGTYSIASESGNPLKFRLSPNKRSSIEFSYKGKHFSHSDEAMLLLLAIAPDGTPRLVADARDWGNDHQYPCVTPYYVQFQQDATETQWTWPQRIEPWLYNLPTNLIFGIVATEFSGKKFNEADRKKKNASLLVAGENFKKIDPSFKPENCVRGN